MSARFPFISSKNDSICLFVARMLQCVCVGPLVRYLSHSAYTPAPGTAPLTRAADWLWSWSDARRNFPGTTLAARPPAILPLSRFLKKCHTQDAHCSLFHFFTHSQIKITFLLPTETNRYMKHFFANSTLKSV